MKKWITLIVFGGMVAFPGLAYTQAQQGQGVPTPEAIRQQIAPSLEGIALAIERGALAYQGCTQRSTPAECAIEAKQLDTARLQQRQLCAQFNIPSRQYGCP